MLPAISGRFRTALPNLPDYRETSIDHLKRIARQLPGGNRVYLPDRVTTIAFLRGTRNMEVR